MKKADVIDAMLRLDAQENAEIKTERSVPENRPAERKDAPENRPAERKDPPKRGAAEREDAPKQGAAGLSLTRLIGCLMRSMALLCCRMWIIT